MAIFLRWTVPEADELNYNITKVERSTSQTGTYTEIASQSISDNTYLDETGTTSNWYRVRFYNSSTLNYSDYSDVLQGGTFQNLCSINDVRAASGLSTTDISDSDLYDLMDMASKETMSMVTVKVIREKVKYIDEVRQNKINGTNTEFYVQNWKGNYLSDFNYNGSIDTGDVTVYLVDSDNNETQATVSSIDISNCKITLSSAPSSDNEMYISYAYSNIDTDTPDPLLSLACSYLAASYAFLRRSEGSGTNVKFGNVTIKEDSLSGYETFYNKYLDMITRASQSVDGGVEFAYNVNQI